MLSVKTAIDTLRIVGCCNDRENPRLRTRDVAAIRRFYVVTGHEIGVDKPDHVQIVTANASISYVSGEPLTEHVHLAFGVDTNEAVDAFYRAAIDAGYPDNGDRVVHQTSIAAQCRRHPRLGESPCVGLTLVSQGIVLGGDDERAGSPDRSSARSGLTRGSVQRSGSGTHWRANQRTSSASRAKPAAFSRRSDTERLYPAAALSRRQDAGARELMRAQGRYEASPPSRCSAAHARLAVGRRLFLWRALAIAAAIDAPLAIPSRRASTSHWL